MNMHNPPHPGEFIREIYLDSLKVSYRTVAMKLNVSPSTFNRLIRGQSSISSEMALRLSKTLGRSPESWLVMHQIITISGLQDKESTWTKWKNWQLPKDLFIINMGRIMSAAPVSILSKQAFPL
jgi:addiction module HigA family antidote